jgi:hypothetical protein
MTKHKRECLRLCEQVGLDVCGVEHRSRHLALHTSKGVLIFPSTPSDHRWRMNMRALARRLARD